MTVYSPPTQSTLTWSIEYKWATSDYIAVWQSQLNSTYMTQILSKYHSRVHVNVYILQIISYIDQEYNSSQVL